MPNYNVPASVVNNFTPDEVREYVSQFKAVDADGNGTLDASEMTTLMKSLGIKEASDPKYVKTLMDEIDEDKDGVINLKEFFGMMNNATSSLRKGLTKKLDDENNSKLAKKKVLKRKQSITERMFKKSKKDKPISQIQAKNLTEQEAAVVSTFLTEEQSKQSFKDKKMVYLNSFDADEEEEQKRAIIDKDDGFEKRTQNLYLLDGTALPVLMTEKSRIKHAIVQVKAQLNITHDNDFAIYLYKQGSLIRALNDDDRCFDVMNKYDPKNTGELELVFKRRTYLPWSPLSQEVRESTDVEQGAHRLAFIEAQYRFLASQYPVTVGQAVELAAILASAAHDEPSYEFILQNIDSFVPEAILYSSSDDQKKLLANRVFNQAKRKEFFGGFRAIEIEKKFLSKCQDNYEKMFGDTFYSVEMVRMAPDQALTTDSVISQPKSKGRCGIGHNGLHLITMDGNITTIAFEDVVRWLVPEGQNIFAIWTEKEVSFMFSNVCKEMQLSLNQYIKEFLARRDTPGKMAHEARKVTEAEVRKIFDEFDVDNGGTLDRNEIYALLVTFGYQLDDDQKEALFDSIDENRDGEIQFEEFLPWYRRHCENEESKKKNTAPASSDDGFLSVTDREVRSKKRDHETSEQSAARLLSPKFKTFKAIMLGSSNVGKTNLVSRVSGNGFSEEINPTLETEYTQFALKLFKGEHARWIKVEVWDTAGQEKYNAIMKSYYRGAVGGAAILVFDVNEEKTLESLKSNWIENLLKTVDPKQTVLTVLANKCDTMEENAEAGQQFVDDHEESIAFYKVSAKNNKNVTASFRGTFEKLYKKRFDEGDTQESEPGLTLVGGKETKNRPTKKNCC